MRSTDNDEYVTEGTQWTRDRVTGYYWKITQRYICNTIDGTTTKDGDPVTSRYPYRVSTEDDHDHCMTYTALNGKQAKLYLKEVKHKA